MNKLPQDILLKVKADLERHEILPKPTCGLCGSVTNNPQTYTTHSGLVLLACEDCIEAAFFDEKGGNHARQKTQETSK